MRPPCGAPSTRNEQNCVAVGPKLIAFGSLPGPLHISVTRWFLTHSSGGVVPAGGGGAGVGMAVGTAVGVGAAGSGVLLQAVASTTSTTTTWSARTITRRGWRMVTSRRALPIAARLGGRARRER